MRYLVEGLAYFYCPCPACDGYHSMAINRIVEADTRDAAVIKAVNEIEEDHSVRFNDIQCKATCVEGSEMRFVVKIKDKFCLWSTVVEAPVTPLLGEGAFREHVLDDESQFGFNFTKQELNDQISMANVLGVGSPEYSMEDVKQNHAGKDEECVSLDSIYIIYGGLRND